MNMNCRIYAACSLGSWWQSASSHAHREIGVTRSEEPSCSVSRFSARVLASGAGLKHRFSTGRSRVAKAMMPRFARAVGRTSKSAQLHSSASRLPASLRTRGGALV
jgi:hypothetical protein